MSSIFKRKVLVIDDEDDCDRSCSESSSSSGSDSTTSAALEDMAAGTLLRIATVGGTGVQCAECGRSVQRRCKVCENTPYSCSICEMVQWETLHTRICSRRRLHPVGVNGLPSSPDDSTAPETPPPAIIQSTPVPFHSLDLPPSSEEPPSPPPPATSGPTSHAIIARDPYIQLAEYVQQHPVPLSAGMVLTRLDNGFRLSNFFEQFTTLSVLTYGTYGVAATVESKTVSAAAAAAAMPPQPMVVKISPLMGKVVVDSKIHREWQHGQWVEVETRTYGFDYTDDMSWLRELCALHLFRNLESSLRWNLLTMYDWTRGKINMRTQFTGITDKALLKLLPDEQIDYQFLLMEEMTGDCYDLLNSTEFQQASNELKNSFFRAMLVQIYSTLALLQRWFQMQHNDLKMDNVFWNAVAPERRACGFLYEIEPGRWTGTRFSESANRIFKLADFGFTRMNYVHQSPTATGDVPQRIELLQNGSLSDIVAAYPTELVGAGLDPLNQEWTTDKEQQTVRSRFDLIFVLDSFLDDFNDAYRTPELMALRANVKRRFRDAPVPPGEDPALYAFKQLDYAPAQLLLTEPFFVPSVVQEEVPEETLTLAEQRGWIVVRNRAVLNVPTDSDRGVGAIIAAAAAASAASSSSTITETPPSPVPLPSTPTPPLRRGHRRHLRQRTRAPDQIN